MSHRLEYQSSHEQRREARDNLVADVIGWAIICIIILFYFGTMLAQTGR